MGPRYARHCSSLRAARSTYLYAVAVVNIGGACMPGFVDYTTHVLWTSGVLYRYLEYARTIMPGFCERDTGGHKAGPLMPARVSTLPKAQREKKAGVALSSCAIVLASRRWRQ